MWENIIFSIIFLQNEENSPPNSLKSLINHFFCFKKIELDIFLLIPFFFFFFFKLEFYFLFSFLLKENIITYLLTLGVWDASISALGEDWTHFDRIVGVVSKEKVRDPHLWPPMGILMNRPYHKNSRVLYKSCCPGLITLYVVVLLFGFLFLITWLNQEFSPFGEEKALLSKT